MPAIVAAEVVADLAITGTEAAIVSAAVEIAVSVIISVGIGLIEQAILGNQSPKPPHARRENFKQPLSPRSRYYGRVKVGGPYAFLDVAPLDGGSVGTLYQVIVMGQGPFDYFEETWLADAKASFLSGANGGSVVVPKNFHSFGDNFVYVYHFDGGNGQVASTVMTSNWPGQWTSDFVGNGIAYCLTLLVSPMPVDFATVYPAGLPPTTCVVRAAKVYDPRDDAQLWNHPGSWLWSSNWALCILDVLKHDDGLRIPFDMLDAGMDVWIAAADWCDQIRQTKNGGSEKHLRIAGGYDLTDPPKNYLRKMLDVADGRIVLRGDGAVVPDIGRWREPELTISDEHIYSYQNFSKGRQKPDIRNQINATFIAPEYGFIQQQADPFVNDDSIGIDGYQPMTLDLDYCPSHAQARVRMKIEESRQDPEGWCGTIITKAYGLKYLSPDADGTPKRFVRFIISELGINSTFEVMQHSFDARSGRNTFVVQEMTSDAFDFDPDTDEGTAPLLAKATSASGVENPFNLQVSVSGTVISATIDTPENTGLHLVMDYRTTDDAVGDDFEAVWTDMSVSSWGGSTGSLSVGRYDIRAQLHDDASDPTPNYSDPLIIRGVTIS